MHNSTYFRNKQLHCNQCRKQYTFHYNERIKFAKLGWNPPIRCHTCRKQKKNNIEFKNNLNTHKIKKMKMN